MNAAAPERSTNPTDKLSGVIERVTFFNEESGFCVLRIKAPGHREEVTVIGSLPSVSAGEWLSGEGWWVRDKEHGLQFKASTIRTVPPTTVEGIEKYAELSQQTSSKKKAQLQSCAFRIERALA